MQNVREYIRSTSFYQTFFRDTSHHKDNYLRGIKISKDQEITPLYQSEFNGATMYAQDPREYNDVTSPDELKDFFKPEGYYFGMGIRCEKSDDDNYYIYTQRFAGFNPSDTQLDSLSKMTGKEFLDTRPEMSPQTMIDIVSKIKEEKIEFK